MCCALLPRDTRSAAGRGYIHTQHDDGVAACRVCLSVSQGNDICHDMCVLMRMSVRQVCQVLAGSCSMQCVQRVSLVVPLSLHAHICVSMPDLFRGSEAGPQLLVRQ